MHFVGRPAGARQLPKAIAKARIERQHDALRTVATDPRRHRLRVANGHATDDDALDTRIEQAAHAFFVADATARLHAEATTGRDAGDGREVFEVARSRAVEIDDVQPGRALIRITRGECFRLEGKGGLLCVVALEQANHLTFAQIDGGNG
jgi:hypothetical protein